MQMRTANAPPRRSGRHFTGKAFVAFARIGAGSAWNVPETDECGTVTDKAILVKSPSHPASSVARLVIEATFTLLPGGQAGQCSGPR